MVNKLSRVECDPKCGFIVQSHDEDEVIEMAKKHAKLFHQENFNNEQVREMMTAM